MPNLGEGTISDLKSTLGPRENIGDTYFDNRTSLKNGGLDEFLDADKSYSQKQMLSYNTQPGHSITHRALSYGANVPLQQVSDMCDLDIILAPACMGYTLVRFRRIHGSTSVFHEAVTFVSNLLEVERQKAVEDTMPSGESELM
ncbi:unnamed protein product [Phytomonas sp. Hart1]|nr:unnamed protein product [Phytomonas sp. Hart1]|eukprot:CCW68830.1 unnamed protein product [Phytomonas sp. isolate Hart1]